MAEFWIRFEMPRNGWMQIYLEKPETKLAMAVSYMFHEDAPLELVRSLRNLLLAKPIASVAWFLRYSEPDSFYFEFKTGKSLTLFQVNEPLPHDKAKTHFEIEMPGLDLVLAFWRGLRCLQSQILDDEFQVGWKSPFPDKELDELTEQIREIKRMQK